MTIQEELIQLRMRVAELEKEKPKARKRFDKIKKENTELKLQIAELKEDLQVLTRVVRSGKERHRLELFLKYGGSSEKYRKIFNIPAELLAKEQEGRLNEEEKALLEEAKTVLGQAASGAPGTDAEPATRNRNPDSRERGNGCGRQSFDPSWPRDLQDIPIGPKCPKCGGDMVEINSQDIHEYLELLRKSLKIIRQVRHKGYCPCCGESVSEDGVAKREIVTAPAEERFVPGGLVGDSLVASSLVDKFFYGLSVTRIANMYQSKGAVLSAQNFANWHMRAGEELAPVAAAIKDHILAQEAVNADETRYQVMDEIGRSDQLKSWMWVICSPRPGAAAAYFHYDPSRSSDIFKDIVCDYGGYLQADCYGGYQAKKQDYSFKLALCYAHMRRNFVDAQKAAAYPDGSAGQVTLDRIFSLIGKIYQADKTHRARWLETKGISEQEFLRIRRKQSLPLIEKFSGWLRERYALHSQDLYIIKAMDYYLEHEPLFKTYLDCASLDPDNNRVERLIRKFSTVRMNTLFAGSPAGARTMATLQSIVQTANLWGLELTNYVTYLLQEVTKMRKLDAQSVDYTRLLPWNLSQKLRGELAVRTFSQKLKPR